MDSYYWDIISYIFLGIGLVLLLIAFIIAARFKVISNTISEIRSRRGVAEPVDNALSVAMSIRSHELDGAAVEAVDSGLITTVVGQKKAENTSDTIVIANDKDKKNNFKIIRNIIVINADPDVIDDNRKNL